MKRILSILIAIAVCNAVQAQPNVGIGTTTPNSKAQLDVFSTSRGLLIPRMTAGDRVAISAPIPAGLMVYETTTNSFWFYNGSAWVQLGSGGGGSHWTASGTHIYNTNTGSVGIGTPSPTSKLHVLGSLRLESTGPDLQFATDGVSKVYVQSDGDDIRMGTNSGNTGGKMIMRMNGTNRIYIDSIGQMGIGTSSPNHSLDVAGKIRSIPENFNSVPGLILYPNPNNPFDNLGPSMISFFNWASNGSGGFDYASKYRLRFDGGLTERLRIEHADHDYQLVLRNNGRVGINVASPLEQFHVAGGNLMVQDGAPILKLRSTSNLASVAEPSIEMSGPTSTLARIQYKDGGLAFNANGTSSSQLFLKDSKLGINNNDPQEELDILGNIIIDGNSPILQLQQFDINKGFVQLSGDDIRIGTNSSNINGKFVVRTANEDQFFVDNAGYVGVGVTGAGAMARVHIGSGLDAGLNSNGYVMLGYPNGSNLILDNNEIMARGANGTVGSLVFQNDGGTVRVGNVSVPAGYKFAVNGKVICDELKVKLSSSGWPDYVFDDKYQLLPLKQVESYIQQNKHLPGIPSAKEVEANGLEVGDMQKRMMEKIEELTLYVIELEKKVEALKTQKK